MLKKMLKGRKGFTLIELVMVIVIIGILAAVAIPKYLGLQDEARKAQEKGVVGGVRGGISVFHADALANETDQWPVGTLDMAVPTATDGLFASVLDIPISSGWTKDSATVYIANKDKGAVEQSYTYDPNNGTFTETP